MPKTTELTNEQRQQIAILRAEGVSVTQIAIRFNICRQTVYRVCRRFTQTGNADKLPRSGRRKITTPREDRYLLRQTRIARFNSAKFLAARWSEHLGRRISTKTTRRRLHSMNLRSRISRRKPLISPVNRRRRVAWAKRVRDWTVEQNWRHFVFSDESRFCLSFNDGRARVWREVNTAYNPENVTFTARKAVSIMVWGCIGIHGVGDLVLVDGNVDHVQYREILEAHLLPSIENIFGDRDHPFIFQDDNAPSHRAAAMDEWFDDHGINRVRWPAQSPDANPIENLWDDISRALVRDRPTTKDDLIRSVFRAWGNITPERVTQLYDTLPRRMRAIIRARGYPTKY